MKKNILNAAMLLCTGVMLMTSCNKDDQQIFRLIVNDNHAKTSLGEGYTTLWQANDQILINSSPLTITVDGIDNNQQVWATAEQPLDPINDQFYAFYAGRATDVTSNVTDAAQSYSFSMPSSYTYVPGTLQSPMAGNGTYPGNDPVTTVTVHFGNLFSLLELEVPMAPAGSSYTITLTETNTANNPLAGDFTTTYNGSTWSTICTGNASYSLTITYNSSETTIYVPIPAGNHMLDIAMTLPGGAQQTQPYTFQAGYYYQINTLPGTPAGGEVIPYPFPTDDGGYAFFGKGNMVFDASHTPNWFLEPNQWDWSQFTVSGKSASLSSSLSWMTSQNQHPENPNNGGTVHGDMYPQGYATLLNDNVHTTNWTTPSQSEWSNFLGLGANQDAKWAYVKINHNGTIYNGLFISPSTSITHSAISYGTTYTTNTTASNPPQRHHWDNVPTMTSADFSALEMQGCLFLPAYGYVEHHGNLGQINQASTNDGYYRTSTATQSATASVMHFWPGTAPAFEELHRGDGVSVRLFFIATSTTSK